MTDGWVAVPPDSTGKKLRADVTTTSGGTNVYTEYVRADHSSVVASNASFAAAIPGVVRVTNLTAASFVVQASLAGGALYAQLPDRLGQLTRASSLSVTQSTNSVILAILPGYARVGNLTYASFLAQVTHPGYIRVTNASLASFLATVAAPGYVRAQNVTYASFLAQASIPGLVRVQNATTAASLLAQVNVPGLVRVTGPASTASFVVGTPGYQRVTSNTAASFLLTAKAVSLTAGSFLASVTIPGFVNVKGPTTRGSTIVQTDHSFVVASNASFTVGIPGILREVTTRGSAVMAVDHSALISVSAASFTVGAQAKSYSTVWPVAQSTGVYNPFTQDTLGRQVVLLNTTPGRSESTVMLLTSGNTAQSVFGAITGNRHYVTDLSVFNQSGTAVILQFVSGITGPVANPTGKKMWMCRSESSALAGVIDQDFITPVFTNVGATFAVYGNLGLSSTTRIRLFASGYQSPV